MSKLTLGTWERRSYGYRAEGAVQSGNRTVPVTVRRPGNSTPESGFAYGMANGWTTGRASMRAAAVEATRFGHYAVTFDYTNTGGTNALAENVRDAVAVLEALPKDMRRAAMGLSMGGAVVTMALRQTDARIEAATLVAPGKYILPQYYSRLAIGRRALAEVKEFAHIGTQPLAAVRLGVTSAGNCVRRPRAVRAELSELLRGVVHQDLIVAKSQPDSPHVRFAYGLQDDLLPPGPQRASIEGLPFDEIVSYDGGHARLAYDPSLANQFFRLDAMLFSSRPRPDRPFGTAA